MNKGIFVATILVFVVFLLGGFLFFSNASKLQKLVVGGIRLVLNPSPTIYSSPYPSPSTPSPSPIVYLTFSPSPSPSLSPRQAFSPSPTPSPRQFPTPSPIFSPLPSPQLTASPRVTASPSPALAVGTLLPVADFGYEQIKDTKIIVFNGTFSSDQDAANGSYRINGISRWYWSFGDGTTAEGSSASHRYSAAGTYNITLTVVDNDGQEDEEVKNIVVSPVRERTTSFFVITGESITTKFEGFTQAIKNVFRLAPESSQLSSRTPAPTSVPTSTPTPTPTPAPRGCCQVYKLTIPPLPLSHCFDVYSWWEPAVCSVGPITQYFPGETCDTGVGLCPSKFYLLPASPTPKSTPTPAGRCALSNNGNEISNRPSGELGFAWDECQRIAYKKPCEDNPDFIAGTYYCIWIGD